MKQIRLKDRILKIETCYECPCLDCEYGMCNINVSIGDPGNAIHKDCPLEDYEDKELTPNEIIGLILSNNREDE